MTATFAVIDFAKYKVTLDPATVTLAGDDATDLDLDVGSDATVIAFLNNHAASAPESPCPCRTPPQPDRPGHGAARRPDQRSGYC